MSEDATVNFPMAPSKMVKGSNDKERLAIWASQEKRGIISLCNVRGKDAEGNERRCYFPLNPVRDPANANAIMLVEKENDAGNKVNAAIARCSFDPDGHGEQFIFPPKKEDEI